MDVTTTNTKIGKFDARFFHLVFEEEFAKVSVDIVNLLIQILLKQFYSVGVDITNNVLIIQTHLLIRLKDILVQSTA